VVPDWVFDWCWYMARDRQFEALVRVLDLEYLLTDPAYADRYERRGQLHPLFEGIFETQPSAEWLRRLDEAGVPCGPMLYGPELFTDPQVAENGLATIVEDPTAGRVHVLGSPIKLMDTPAAPGQHVPALDEHKGTSWAPRSAKTAVARPSNDGPLAGAKVLDLAIMYAGPGTTAYLGDMGADVIKVEAPNLDDSRRLQSTKFLGPNSRAFMTLNRNKRGIVVDLRQPDGQDVLHRLVRDADVLLHNYRAGVSERLGVDYPTLSKINPRLVYAWVTGFGPTMFTGPCTGASSKRNIASIMSSSAIQHARRWADGFVGTNIESRCSPCSEPYSK